MQPNNAVGQRMRILSAILAPLCLLLGGCVGYGAIHTLPAVTFDCKVIDYESRRPIPGAKVVFKFLGNDLQADPREIVYGPFTTDSAGQVQIVTEKKSIWLSPSAAFAGGYSCDMMAFADGYWERKCSTIAAYPKLLKEREEALFEMRSKK